MAGDCGCGEGKSTSGTGQLENDAEAPSLAPLTDAIEGLGGTTMSDVMPTQTPPESAVSANAAADTAPSLQPSEALSASGGGITAWINGKRVSALWGKNQNRNSWAHITGVGWKKLANNSDSAVVALTMLAAHAKQTQTNYNYREEADGMIHESYVW